MKKYIIMASSLVVSVAILATTVLALSTRQFTATEVDFKIVMNGEERTFHQPIVAIEGRTYLPIREFCDAVGYSISWDEEGRVVSMSDKKGLIFNDDLFTSREGVLENGRKYVFYGTDKYDFSLENYIEEFDLSAYIVYDVKIQEETLEKTLEKVEELSAWGLHPNAEAEGIAVYYDPEAEAFLFKTVAYGLPRAGGFNVVVVNCKDGVATLYSNGAA